MTFPEPPPLAAPTTCFFHTDRETGRRCTRCGRYACPECLHQAAVGSHCWECVKAAQPPMTQQVKAKLAQPMLVTKIIIAMNALVFVAQVGTGTALGLAFGSSSQVPTDFERHFSLVVAGVGAGQWWRIITSGFLHFGIVHIGFNMLILWRLGQDLEDGVGRLRFGTIYAASLIGGSLGVILLNANGPTAGASGAVFGLAGAATIALWQRGVRFWHTGWGPLLAINLVFTFVGPNISIGGHLGGLVTGSVLGALLLRPGVTKNQTRFGYLVATLVIVGTLVAAPQIAHNRHPSCVTRGLEVYCRPQDF